MSPGTPLDPRAVGDGAEGAAGEVRGTVWLPPGTCACAVLRVLWQVSLTAEPTWA